MQKPRTLTWEEIWEQRLPAASDGTEDYSVDDKDDVISVLLEQLVKEGSRTLMDPSQDDIENGRVLMLTWNDTATMMLQAGAYIESNYPCDKITPYVLSIWCKLTKYILSEVEKGLKMQAEKDVVPNSSDEPSQAPPVGLKKQYQSKGLQDAVTAFKRCYLAIIACFSKNKTVRKTKFEDHPEIPELFDQVLEVSENHLNSDLDDALWWLQRMWKTVGDDHKYLIIEPSTRLGVVANVSGISDLAQLQCQLMELFPVHPEQLVRFPSENAWMFYNYTTPLNEELSALGGKGSSMDTFLSSEAAMDEVPRIFPGEEGRPPLVVSQGENDSDVELMTFDDEPISVVLLLPATYVRDADPNGVFLNMKPEMEVLGLLKEDQVVEWLQFFSNKMHDQVLKDYDSDPQLRMGSLRLSKFSSFQPCQ